MNQAKRPTFTALAVLAIFGALFAIGGTTGWWTSASNEQAIGEASRWCERVAGGFLQRPTPTQEPQSTRACGPTKWAEMVRFTKLLIRR